MWSKWSRSKWSFSFSECVICSLYINIKYLYIVEDFDNSKSFWPNDQMTAGRALPSSHVIPLQVLCKSHFSPILRNGLTTDLKRTWNGGIADTLSKKGILLFCCCAYGFMVIMIISRHISVFWLLQSNSDFFLRNNVFFCRINLQDRNIFTTFAND